MYLDENRSYERDFPPDEILVAASLFKLERDRGARDITVLSFFQAISCFSLFQPQISHSQNKKKIQTPAAASVTVKSIAFSK